MIHIFNCQALKHALFPDHAIKIFDTVDQTNSDLVAKGLKCYK